MAKKYQLQFAHYLICDDLQESTVCENQKYEIASNFLEIVLSKLNISEKTDLKFYSKIIYRGHDFRQSDYIATFIEDVDIYKVIEITVFKIVY